MDEIAAVADDIYRRRVLAARDMDPFDKLMAGPRLFDIVCQRMISGIQLQYPDATPEEIQEELKRRLDLAAHLEANHGQ